jgi:hypothetical protein
MTTSIPTSLNSPYPPRQPTRVVIQTPLGSYDKVGDPESTFTFAESTAGSVAKTQKNFVAPQQAALSNYVDFFQKVNTALLPLKDAISSGADNKIKVDFSNVVRSLRAIAGSPAMLANGFATKADAERFVQSSGLSLTSGDFPITGTEAETFTIWLPTKQVQALADSMPVDWKFYNFDNLINPPYNQDGLKRLLISTSGSGNQVGAGRANFTDWLTKEVAIVRNTSSWLYHKTQWSDEDLIKVDLSYYRVYLEGFVKEPEKYYNFFYDGKRGPAAIALFAKSYGTPIMSKSANPYEWDNAKYNAWLAGKDSIVSQLQQFSQFLSERLGHVNSLYESLTRVFSQTVSETYETDRQFYNSL